MDSRSATALAAIALSLASVLTATAARGQCPGDCDFDGRVVSAELVMGVRIALGAASLAGCTFADGDGDGHIGIADLLRNVRTALEGCPKPAPTPVGDALFDNLVAIMDEHCDARWVGTQAEIQSFDMPSFATVACEEGVEGSMLTLTRLADSPTAASLVARKSGLTVELAGAPAKTWLQQPSRVGGPPGPAALSGQIDCWHVTGHAWKSDTTRLVDLARAVANATGDLLKQRCDIGEAAVTDGFAAAVQGSIDEQCDAGTLSYLPTDLSWSPQIVLSCERPSEGSFHVYLKNLGTRQMEELILSENLGSSGKTLRGYPSSTYVAESSRPPTFNGRAAVGCWYVTWSASNADAFRDAANFAERTLFRHHDYLLRSCFDRE